MSTEKYLEHIQQKPLYVSKMPFPKHICFDFYAGFHHEKILSWLGKLEI